jgi:hypothetical protein
MEGENEIVNKVAGSSLLTFDLEDLYSQGPRAALDISSLLFEGLILKEKDVREFVKNENWSAYTGKYVAVYCSTDAIIPTWAFMLLASRIQPYAKKVVFGDPLKLEEALFLEAISKVDIENYRDQRVVVKGCSKVDVPASAYFEITAKLVPVVKSIMFGEACSTVPVFKNMDK